MVVNVTSGDIPIDPFWLLGFAIKGNLVVNGVTGVTTHVFATGDSIPRRGNVTLTGVHTTLTRINDAFGLAYTPGTAANWAAPAPATVQEALDRLAAQAAAQAAAPVP